MKITDITVRLVSYKLPVVWTNGMGTTTKKDEVLVFVHTNEGVTGIGASYHGYAARSIKSIIEYDLKPLLIGEDASAIQLLWERMFAVTVHLGSAAILAMSGVDTALWDLMGKKANQPLYKLLGGGGTKRVPAYVGCMTLGVQDIPSLVEESAKWTGQGFRSLKLRGGAGIQKDVAAVKAVREAVGPSVDISIDINARYSWPEAVRICKLLEPYDIYWVEDPFDYTVAWHQADLSKLAALNLTPIASGGNIFSAMGFRNFMELGGVHYIQPDVVKCGGITPAIEIARMASAYNIQVAPHTLAGLGQMANLHFTAAIPANVRNYLEWEPTTPNPMRETMLTNPIKVENGDLLLPDGPGLGTELNMDVVEELAFIEGLPSRSKGRGRQLYAEDITLAAAE